MSPHTLRHLTANLLSDDELGGVTGGVSQMPVPISSTCRGCGGPARLVERGGECGYLCNSCGRMELFDQ